MLIKFTLYKFIVTNMNFLKIKFIPLTLIQTTMNVMIVFLISDKQSKYARMRPRDQS